MMLCLEVYKCPCSLLLILNPCKFKCCGCSVFQFDDGRADLMENLDAKTIKEFIGANRLALVTEFSQEAAAKIFGGDVKNHLLLFISKKADDFKEKYDVFRQVAPDYKGKVRHG